jgi:hypothetical protein
MAFILLFSLFHLRYPFIRIYQSIKLEKLAIIKPVQLGKSYYLGRKIIEYIIRF